MRKISNMENINFIYGKTPDGRLVTLDGFRVESYETYANDKGEYCVDIYFKSGQQVTVLADDEEFIEIPIPDQLDGCRNADPEIVAAPHPALGILCRKKDDGRPFMFDVNAVEFYIVGEDADKEYGTDREVELHFASGRTVTVIRDPEMDDLDGESLEVALLRRRCRDQDRISNKISSMFKPVTRKHQITIFSFQTYD